MSDLSLVIPSLARLFLDGSRLWDRTTNMAPVADKMMRDFEESLTRWYPTTDIADTEGNWTITVELPGCSKDDVSIEYSGNTLTVSGEKKSSTTTPTYSERYYGSYSRTFTVPTNVDSANTTATFTNGVLTITIPKVTPKTNKITVN